jgi:hypothetical protein
MLPPPTGGWCVRPAPASRLSASAVGDYVALGMNEMGKMLFILGAVIAVAGLILWSGFGKSWLGRLPGDVHYSRGNFSFYFPVVTCVLLSLILTFILWLFRK